MLFDTAVTCADLLFGGVSWFDTAVTCADLLFGGVSWFDTAVTCADLLFGGLSWFDTPVTCADLLFGCVVLCCWFDTAVTCADLLFGGVSWFDTAVTCADLLLAGVSWFESDCGPFQVIREPLTDPLPVYKPKYSTCDEGRSYFFTGVITCLIERSSSHSSNFTVACHHHTVII